MLNINIPFVKIGNVNPLILGQLNGPYYGTSGIVVNNPITKTSIYYSITTDQYNTVNILGISEDGSNILYICPTPNPPSGYGIFGMTFIIRNRIIDIHGHITENFSIFNGTHFTFYLFQFHLEVGILHTQSIITII